MHRITRYRSIEFNTPSPTSRSRAVRRISIRLNIPLLIFLLTPFFEPGSLVYLAPAIAQVFNIWLIFSVISIAFIYMVRIKISKIVIAVAFFELSFIFSTLINNGSIWECTIICVKTIAFCMLLETGIYQGSKRLISAIIIILGIECTINGITILAFPKGMYTTNDFYFHWENWFLGFRNIHVLYILPLLCLFWIFSIYRDMPKAIRFLGIAFFAIPIYFAWSATGMVGISVFLILYIFSELHILARFLEIKKYVLAFVVGFLGFVIFRIQKLFEPFIVSVLERNATFSGRTMMWDRALEYIKEHWLIGAGINTVKVDAAILKAPHTHDYLLQIMYQAGLVGLIGFIVIIILVVQRLTHAKDRKYSYIISSTLFSFLVMLLTESYGRNMSVFFGIITMAYHVDTLADGLSDAAYQERGSSGAG